jgi:hypothetical protein
MKSTNSPFNFFNGGTMALTYIEQQQRRKERSKMTQAEKWLTKMTPEKPNAAAIAYAPFKEQWRPKNNVFRG